MPQEGYKARLMQALIFKLKHVQGKPTHVYSAVNPIMSNEATPRAVCG